MPHDDATTPLIPDLADVPRVMTRAEACAVLRISMRKLDRLVAIGKIKYLPGLGPKSPRIARSEIERVLLGGERAA